MFEVLDFNIHTKSFTRKFQTDIPWRFDVKFVLYFGVKFAITVLKFCNTMMEFFSMWRAQKDATLQK